MIYQHTDFFKNEDNFAKTAHIPSIPIFESKLDYIPEITIAIPTYKRANLLKEALESAINQIDYTNYDIIVVDNNPERGCETEKLMILYSNNSMISYYKNADNLGMTGNWNRLFTLAKGKYVVMLHDDDVLEPIYLITLNQFLKKASKRPDAVFVQYTIFKKKDDIVNKTIIKNISSLYSINIKQYDFLFGCIVTFFGGCFNRKTVLNLGGFSENFYPSLDYEFFVRICRQGYCISLSGHPLVKYRILNNESMKASTLINSMIMDKRIKQNILSNNLNYLSILFKSVFIVSSYNYLRHQSILFGVIDKEMDENIAKIKRQITFIDKIIYFFIIRVQSLILKFRRHKISLMSTKNQWNCL